MWSRRLPEASGCYGGFVRSGGLGQVTLLVMYWWLLDTKDLRQM